MKKFLFLLLTITMLCVSALGFTACNPQKPEHTHTFDKQVISADYLKTEATCQSKATYYYSCECGEKGTETFESGELASHKFTNYVSDNNATCENDGTKTANCDYDCGTKDTVTDSGSKLSHVFDKEVVEDKYLKLEATCKNKAEYYKSCVCGESGTDTFEYGSLADHVYEDGKCKWCEDILDGYHFHDYSKRIVEDKYLKKEATCKSRAEYYKSCECGEYGEETFKTGDFAEHKYINGKCKWCEKTDPNAPTQPDNPNPPDNPEHTCLFNQMVAENKYLKSEATCEKKALYHYSCECGEFGEDSFEYGSYVNHVYENGECKWCGLKAPSQSQGLYERVGNTIFFGSYPQTKVTDTTIIDVLGGSSAPVSTNTWISYNYYEEGAQTDCMYYKDVTLNGEKYRGVYIKKSRPNETVSSSSTNTYQDENGYDASSVYWFKYEPIVWEIVEENSGIATLVCKMIIDSQAYQNEYYYFSQSDYYYYTNSNNAPSGTCANNYYYSTIRAWLNDTFYNTAFNDLQKTIIQITEVDNSVESTGYDTNQFICENTNDKVYLLSYKEATTYYNSYRARCKKATDYAQCQGIDTYRDDLIAYQGNGRWWMRSPDNYYSWRASKVDNYGYSDDSLVSVTSEGVVPSLMIQLFDVSHVHVFDNQVITKDYLKSEATCENKELYYYSCSCGAKGEESFEYRSYANHAYVNGECKWCEGEEPILGDLYHRAGNVIYFGSYPQRIITDANIINELGGSSAPVSTNTWISYNYYEEGAQTDCMYYKDVTLNGEKYRGVYIKKSRPYETTKYSSSRYTYQGANGYDTSSVYWFKYEPIEWEIVEENSGIATLVCKMIIDSQAYQNEYYYYYAYDNYYYTNSNNAPSETYANNYYYSTIRAWLNDTFYNTAFNDLQKEIIQITNVDNSLDSTGDTYNPYVCENTNDKVYLLSYKEANTYFTDNSFREKKTTDYAQSQGAFTYWDAVVKYQCNGWWWLRSPSSSFYSYFTRIVEYVGNIEQAFVNRTNGGVVPVLRIQL